MANSEQSDTSNETSRVLGNGVTEIGSAVQEPKGSRWKRGLAPLLWMGRGVARAALVLLVFLACLWSIGFALRQGWFPDAGDSEQASASEATGDTRYICPMMCVPPTTEPGRCPVCGMELVEATSSGDGDGVSISIEPVARRLIGVQTAMAKLETADRIIRTIGSIAYDESRLATISAYVDGRLEKLYADYVGVPVQSGDDLALLYSPELYTAQAEFLAAETDRGTSRFVDATSMRELATEKLFELGMNQEQIDTLRQEQRARSRIRIKSPQSGTVIEKLAVEGDYVKTGQGIYRVADLTTVWMMLDLFPDDAARILFGQEVEAEINSAPGVVFTGRVAFVDPTVNPVTRSVRVRVEMLNIDGKLRPGDYASARIKVPALPQDQVYDPALAGKYISPMHPQVIRDQPGNCPICDMKLIPTSELGFATEPIPQQQAVTIPRDAVLMAGDSSVVYVETEPGRFEIRRIALGALTDDKAVVAEGLNPGEMVATQGNFLLDSQSQLAGNPSLLDPSKAPRYAPGPLVIDTPSEPTMLVGETARYYDNAFRAYFDIQAALASDTSAPPVAVNSLVQNLVALLSDSNVPDVVQSHLFKAREAAERMVGPVEKTRVTFRTLSHALIHSIYLARGEETQQQVKHFYCPMVPGGGGDWLQPGGELRNPYWVAEMLSCGEMVRDLSLAEVESKSAPADADPFEGLEMQSLDPEITK